MEAKKNEKLRLEKNSGLYFVFGLFLVLMLTYLALEWKSFEKSVDDLVRLELPDQLLEQEPPILKLLEPPKPKQIIAPPLLKIKDDTEDIEDTLFDIPEVDQNLEIPDLNEIEVMEVDSDTPINFIVVEDKPIFPGCETATDKYACFQEKIQKHIRKNFNYPDMAINLGQQGKVYVQFTIEKDGSLGDLRLRGPYKILENEAERIILKLPKMTPGKQRGTPVKVPFAVPINFVLN